MDKGWGERLLDSVRIVWAIAAKDFIEALKNKNTIALILTCLFMVIAYRGMPLLANSREKTAVLLYDAGDSALVALLENSQTFRVVTFATEELMKREMGDAEVPEIAIVIPDGFDQALERGETPSLQGFVLQYWSQSDITELKHDIEAEVSRLLGRSVEIQLQPTPVYPNLQSGGLGMWATLSMLFLMIMIGLILIPHLMLEEKQTHTLDALLVSPASAGKIMAAKALVGLFYCMLGIAIVIAIYHNMVLHWWLVILAALFGSLFTVSIGLWLGIKIDNRGQLTLWSWVFIMPLFLPVFLSLLEELLPEFVVKIFHLFPTVVIFNLVRDSLAQPLPVASTFLKLGWILVWASLILLVVALMIRRRDKEGSIMSALWSEGGETAPESSFPLLALIAANLPMLRKEGSRNYQPAEDMDIGTANEDAGRGAWQGVRIVWAIAAKDLQEAFHNKLLISIMLGALIMVLNSSVLPFLINLQARPTAIIYDEGQSTIFGGLSGGDEYRMGFRDTLEEMKQTVTGSPVAPIGLVIPADFDQRAGNGELIELQGYVVHWADMEKVNQWKVFFEQQISQASWSKVQISIDDRILYPASDAGGQGFSVAFTMTLVIMIIGAVLIPLLMVEEKEARTFDALLVSPARYSHVVVGKALAGVIYCLVAAAVVLLVNQKYIVHWETALLAVLLGIVFTVAIGLLVGVLTDSPTSASLWGSLIMLLIIAPTVLYLYSSDKWSPLIQSLLTWFPGSVIVNLFRNSMANQISFNLLLTSSMAVVSVAGVIYLLSILVIRRSDR